MYSWGGKNSLRLLRANSTGWPSPNWKLNEEETAKIRLLTSLNQRIDEFEALKTTEANRVIQPPIFNVVWRVAAVLILVSGILTWFIKSGTSENQAPGITVITKKTEKGQKATITLPDGTLVRLNAESSVQYASSFTSAKQREVVLTGEAYFNVTEDESKPFIVKTDQINTIVLGTSFNINSYAELPQISVTLETGKVKVETNNETGIIRSFEIVPGEQITFNRSSREMHKKSVNLKKFLAWKEGNVILEGETMHDVAILLEKWYDVSFQFSNENLGRCGIYGEFKSDNLQNILKNIEFLTELEFQLENRIVVVSGTGCNERK